MQVTRYDDRAHAARVLGAALRDRGPLGDVPAHRPGALVLGLPRGGVPVAHGVAEAMAAPLDVLVVRKLGCPGREELAMGAVATGGILVLNEDVVTAFAVSQHALDQVLALELHELRRRERVFRGERPPPALQGRHVVLVDDGLATGATMRAAIRAVRQRQPAQVVVAVPVAPRQTVEMLRGEADDVVCPLTPERFLALGQLYEDFTQTTDDEVRALLEHAWAARGAPAPDMQ